MQLKKILAAGTLAALMAGSSIALAADLSNYPQPFVTADGAADFLVVVGATANPADVIGAVDIATGLGGESTTEKASAGTTTTVSLIGKSEEIALDNNLTTASGTFPAAGLKEHHVPELSQDIKIAWEWQTDDKIDAHEEIMLGDINMSRNPATYNGTIYMQVPDPTGDTQQKDNAAFYYKYVFDETMEGQGNLSSTYPLAITLLGTVFTITDIPQTYQIKAMTGDYLDIPAGETNIDTGFEITPVAAYTNNYWDIKVGKGDATPVTKKLQVGASSDTEYTIDGEKIKLRIISNVTKTTYSEGTSATQPVVSIVAGSITEVVYDETTATTEGTTTTGNNTFPDGSKDYKFDFSIATAGKFTKNDYIAVYYDPWISGETQNGQPLNLTDGQGVTLPNDIEIQFAAMNTETYATVNIQRAEVNLYYNGTSDTTTKWDSVPAVKLTTTDGTFVNGTAIDKNEVYICYQNTTDGASTAAYLAAKDSGGRIRNETTSINLNSTSSANVVYLLDYGDYSDTLTITAGVQPDYDITIVDKLGTTVVANFTINSSATAGQRIYLGDGLSDTAGAGDVIVNGTNSAGIYKDYHLRYGVKVESIGSNANADNVVLKVPVTQLKGVVAIGKDITVGGAAGTTYKEANPIKTAVGKLDTEIGDTEKSEKNIVLVGGPCVNTLVRTLLNSTAATCTSDFENAGLGYTAGTAMVKYVANAWGTGKAALIVAGYHAADTRSACSVLQDYGTNADLLVGTEAKVVA